MPREVMSTDRNRVLFSTLALLAASSLGAGCGDGAGGAVPRPPEGAPRLVVLYSTCTLNKEFLSPYGLAVSPGSPGDAAAIPYTPNLQAFADESLVFERHNTEAGQSGVAFASIYTGTHADRHGVYQHPKHVPEDLLLVTEAFAGRGYETHFWSGQSMASALLGYGQGVPDENIHHTHIGFTKRAKELPPGFLRGTTANGPEFEALLAGLAENTDRHAFVQINFTITHELYHEYADLEKILAFEAAYPGEATGFSRREISETLKFFEDNRHSLQLDFPATKARLGMRRADVERLDAVLRLAYKACVAQLDDYFGRFLAKIRAAGLLDQSVIAFTADHGETFYEEGELFHWMHGLQLAPTVLEVPWIIRGPRAQRFPGVTRSVDVFPTLIGLAGLTLPASVELEGRNLAPLLNRDATLEDPGLLAFSHTSTLGEARIARYRREGYQRVVDVLPEADPRHMWVRVRDRDMIWEMRRGVDGGMATVAFDLAEDPRRANDLFDAENPQHVAMVARLAEYRERLIENYSDASKLSQREILDELEGLGYVGEEGD